MATTTLNTRIQLKYDTYENWTTNNPVLLAGEVAVTTVQSAQAPVSQVPAILFKVGDGTNNFNTLNWASAIAADVYPWAKASVKPTYQASEIEGLEDYISGQIDDTDTQYQIIASGTNGIQLQSRPKTGGAWSNVGSPITITYTLVEGSANGTVSFNGVDVPVHGLGSAAYEASTAFDAAGTAAGVQTTVTGTSGDQSSAITIYGTRKYAAEQATAAQTAATTAANSYTDGQITQAKTDLIGTGDATSTTIKGAVAESKTYADTQIAAKGVPSTEGVPTDYLLSPAGWVAPPSGGGENWELIQDITFSEDTTNVEITQDMQSNPISLLHVKGFLLCQKDADVANAPQISFYFGSLATPRRFTVTMPPTTSVSRTATFDIQAFSGFVVGYVAAGASIVTTNMQSGPPGTDSLYEIPEITIRVTNDSCIAIGSRLVVYGVKG